jgi:hypothetical protein
MRWFHAGGRGLGRRGVPVSKGHWEGVASACKAIYPTPRTRQEYKGINLLFNEDSSARVLDHVRTRSSHQGQLIQDVEGLDAFFNNSKRSGNYMSQIFKKSVMLFFVFVCLLWFSL